MTSPTNNQKLAEQISFKGRIYDKYIKDYFIAYKETIQPSEYNAISEGDYNHIDTNSLITLWDSSGLTGDYQFKIFAEDKAGNTNSVLINNNLTNSEDFVIRMLPSETNYISPNGDNIFDYYPVKFMLNYSTDITIKIYQVDEHSNEIFVRIL